MLDQMRSLPGVDVGISVANAVNVAKEAADLRSHPSRTILTMIAVVIVTTLFLPYSPLASVMGFVPLPLLLIIFSIAASYSFAAEMTKRWVYTRML